MDELKPVDLDVLYAQIRALEAARDDLSREAGDDAPRSARRLAHFLRRHAAQIGLSEVSTAAAMVEESPPETLLEAVGILVERLSSAASLADSRRATILVVASDPTDEATLQGALAGPTREIVSVASRAAAARVLAERKVAAVFLDLLLPDGDGRDLLLDIRDDDQTASLPVIVFTTSAGESKLAECVALGADDFLYKPLQDRELSTAAATALRRGAQVTAEMQRDALTGLPNRAAFQQAFRHWQARSARMAKPNALAFLDLDHFKAVNDTFGHDVGDTVLRETARRVATCLRESDILARWGGEEFVALFPENSEEQARHALNRALLDLRQARVQARPGEFVSVTFSAGVTDIKPEESLDEALLRADRYLYLAKAVGRNRVFSAEFAVEPPQPLIFFADDDLSSSVLVAELLSKQGFEVIHFGDGASLLAATEESTPAMVLLDIRMPGMDGFQVLEELRERPSFQGVPVVLITALGSEHGLVRGFELGADEYIVKPIVPTTFLARIFRLMKSRLRSEGAPPSDRTREPRASGAAPMRQRAGNGLARLRHA